MLLDQEDDYDEDKAAPKLQLEYAGGGPGSVVRKAAGSADGDNFISGEWLPDPPWWFIFLDKKQRSLSRNQFLSKSLNEAFAYLEAIGIPPIPRLAIGIKWGLINPNKDGFSRQDLKELIVDARVGIAPLPPIPKHCIVDPGMVEVNFERQLESIESAVAYQLWRFERKRKKAKTN